MLKRLKTPFVGGFESFEVKGAEVFVYFSFCQPQCKKLRLLHKKNKILFKLALKRLKSIKMAVLSLLSRFFQSIIKK